MSGLGTEGLGEMTRKCRGCFKSFIKVTAMSPVEN